MGHEIPRNTRTEFQSLFENQADKEVVSEVAALRWKLWLEVRFTRTKKWNVLFRAFSA